MSDELKLAPSTVASAIAKAMADKQAMVDKAAEKLVLIRADSCKSPLAMYENPVCR